MPRARLARRPVTYGDVLLSLAADTQGEQAHVPTPGANTTPLGDAGGLQFTSPLSGRYYAKPGPDQPPFVQVGDIIARGQTVALLEVMKTFNRIAYGGEDLPERVKIVGIGPGDGDDLDEGDAILDLEPA